jgi:DUF4097 and DUF4098 domain-containing protein YvlB
MFNEEGTVGNGSRTIWIVVIVILLALLLCCCVLVVGAVVTGLFAAIPFTTDGGVSRVSETTEQVLTVGEEPALEVENFAGDILVRPGESGQIAVMVTKRAMGEAGLDRIDVEVSETDEGVRVVARRPGPVTSVASVEVTVTVPPETELELDTGAGNVRVNDIEGEISAHTGAGNIRVQRASAPVRLDTGAGEIHYEGDPRGENTFSTGAGNITLRLPADADVEVELDSGIGNVSIGDFDVEGDVSGSEVDGTIGTGEDATIDAHTGAGNITLVEE